MVIILIDNGLVIFVFCRNKNLHRNITNYYILQLAISDFVTGIFTAFHMAVRVHPDLLNNHYACLARFCTMMIVCSISMLSILLITYDRFVAIVMPFYYRSNASKTRVLLKCLIIDAIPIVLCLIIPILWKKTLKSEDVCLMVTVFPRAYIAIIIIPTFFLTVLVKIIMYAIIFFKMSKRLDRAKKMMQNGSSQSHLQLERISKSNIALTKTGAIVLLSFIICWTPFIVHLIIQLCGRTSFEFANTMSLATFMLILLNSALNPVIYVLRLSYFRRELRRAFGSKTALGMNDGSFTGNRSGNSSVMSGRGGVYYVQSQSLIERGRRANRIQDNRRQSGENLLSYRKRSEDSVDSVLWRQLVDSGNGMVSLRIKRSASCPSGRIDHSMVTDFSGYNDLLSRGSAKIAEPTETILSSL